MTRYLKAARARASAKRLGATVMAMVMIATCAKHPRLARTDCSNADARLTGLLQPLQALRETGCTAKCDALRHDIERLSIACPGSPSALLANAVIAYDDHRPIPAQQWLDQLFAQPGSHPDAAELRARIAIEDGNLPFAVRLLKQQIGLAPDHAGMHEAYGAALYFDRDLAGATAELATAARLGAPTWRIAYGLGLIDEASGRMDDAVRHYTEALEGKPGWPAAQMRLNALIAKARKPVAPR